MISEASGVSSQDSSIELEMATWRQKRDEDEE
jgi:hypothetical protein